MYPSVFADSRNIRPRITENEKKEKTEIRKLSIEKFKAEIYLPYSRD